MSEPNAGSPRERRLLGGVVVLAASNAALLGVLAWRSPEPEVADPEPCDCAAEIAAAAAAGGLDPAALSAPGEPVPEDGEDPREQPGIDPETSARQFLSERMDALQAAGAAQGVSVDQWMPTPDEVDAAVVSEGPDTPASQVVIAKLRAGHDALGLEFEIPPGPTAP